MIKVNASHFDKVSFGKSHFYNFSFGKLSFIKFKIYIESESYKCNKISIRIK